MELSELKRIKFVTALVIVFKITKHDDATKYSTFHSNSKAETIIVESDIDDVFESIYSKIISKIHWKKSGWIIDYTISISKYNPLAGSSYIKLLKELSDSKKVLFIFKITTIMNDLNGIWSNIYILLITIQQELEKITKILQENLILKISYFQLILDIFTKLEKRTATGLAFFVIKIRKNIQSISQ